MVGTKLPSTWVYFAVVVIFTAYCCLWVLIHKDSNVSSDLTWIVSSPQVTTAWTGSWRTSPNSCSRCSKKGRSVVASTQKTRASSCPTFLTTVAGKSRRRQTEQIGGGTNSNKRKVQKTLSTWNNRQKMLAALALAVVSMEEAGKNENKLIPKE